MWPIVANITLTSAFCIKFPYYFQQHATSSLLFNSSTGHLPRHKRVLPKCPQTQLKTANCLLGGWHPYSTGNQQLLLHCGYWGSNPYKMLAQLRRCWMTNVNTADLCRATDLLPKCTAMHQTAHYISNIYRGNTPDPYTGGSTPDPGERWRWRKERREGSTGKKRR